MQCDSSSGKNKIARMLQNNCTKQCSKTLAKFIFNNKTLKNLIFKILKKIIEVKKMYSKSKEIYIKAEIVKTCKKIFTKHF